MIQWLEPGSQFTWKSPTSKTKNPNTNVATASPKLPPSRACAIPSTQSESTTTMPINPCTTISPVPSATFVQNKIPNIKAASTATRNTINDTRTTNFVPPTKDIRLTNFNVCSPRIETS